MFLCIKQSISPFLHERIDRVPTCKDQDLMPLLANAQRRTLGVSITHILSWKYQRQTLKRWIDRHFSVSVGNLKGLHSIKLTFMTPTSYGSFLVLKFSVNEYWRGKSPSPYIVDLVTHVDMQGKSCQDQYSHHKAFDKYCIEKRGRWASCWKRNQDKESSGCQQQRCTAESRRR